MSLIPGRYRTATEDWRKIASYLTRYCGLSEDDIQRILTLAQSREISFSEAAINLGLAAQSDIEAALAQTYRAPVETTARPSSELIVAHDPFDPHSESIRALRTELLLRQTDSDCNVFAIVSPSAGEGRSRLAAELAIVCSQLGQPTLLVDADLRRPRQHELFQADNSKGLSVALGKSEMPSLQSVNGLPKLLLLTAGPQSGNPLELLSDALLGDLISGWRRRYKHIVLDTPPVSLYSDALAVATHAGGVLSVFRTNHTKLAASKEMLSRLVITQARVFGSVVNHF